MSVLLPARNAASTLDSSLRSVARQTETNFECVVVDDASTDATAAIASRYASDDRRFRVVQGSGDGLVAALTTGLASCTAPLIARMDADDLMRRTRLSLQCAELDARPYLSGIGARVRLFPRATLTNGLRNYETWLNGLASPEDIRRDAFVECPLAHPSWTFRREVFERFPYRAHPWPEDYDLLLRALSAGCSFASTPARLISWRDSDSRLSRTHNNYSDGAFIECKAEHLATSFLASRSSYVLWGYGSTGRLLRAALARRDRLPSEIVELHPRRIGERIHEAMVVEPDALPRLRARAQEHGEASLRILVSVAGAKPRGQIREALAAMHFTEGHDFICVA